MAWFLNHDPPLPTYYSRATKTLSHRVDLRGSFEELRRPAPLSPALLSSSFAHVATLPGGHRWPKCIFRSYPGESTQAYHDLVTLVAMYSPIPRRLAAFLHRTQSKRTFSGFIDLLTSRALSVAALCYVNLAVNAVCLPSAFAWALSKNEFRSTAGGTIRSL